MIPAPVVVCKIHPESALIGDGFENFYALPHDLRSGAVTGNDRYVIGFCHSILTHSFGPLKNNLIFGRRCIPVDNQC
jgi:hypothetical protein